VAVPPGAFSGRFTFARTLEASDRPWDLLARPQVDGAIPVVADDETARYILHLEPGQTLGVTDAQGRRLAMRLVGTLATSVFQGELLMGEQNFVHLFGSEGGFRTLLVDAPQENLPAVQARLRDDLADYAVAVDGSGAYLARYLEVANTYLATFRLLGGLGLVLGSAALAVVLLRNLLERRGELALLAALGYSPGRRAAMLFLEQAMLLAAGLAIGLGCALLGAMPVVRSGRSLDLPMVLATLVTAAAVGMALPAILAFRRAGQFRPADLRRE
jgi:hypothetical protein